MESESSWSYPAFTQPFQAIQFQQGNDAQFCARISGNPLPTVSWTHRGRPLVSSQKHEVIYDQISGQVSLKIRDLGPGDEGQYCCTLSNPYGSTTATLSVNPDVNRLRHRGLSPTCCRRTLQKRIKEYRKIQEAELRNEENHEKIMTL